MHDDTKAFEALKAVSTATITTILLKKGLRNVWMRGTRPLRPGQPRLVKRDSSPDRLLERQRRPAGERHS